MVPMVVLRYCTLSRLTVTTAAQMTGSDDMVRVEDDELSRKSNAS
jgi:hypothetical protein